MTAADTSVIVAAFASWHEHHDAARRALDAGLRMIAHCAIESYAVLTRLPAPHRAPAPVVRDFLSARFVEPWLELDSAAYRRFLLELPQSGISGGASYDALVAATAARGGARLVSCDRRALPVYQRYGVQVALL